MSCEVQLAHSNISREKFSPAEWIEYFDRTYDQALDARINSSDGQNETNNVIKLCDALEKQAQNCSTKLIKERIHDINFWETELRREIVDIVAETQKLLLQKKYLQNSLLTTDATSHIVTDNLNCRLYRKKIDNVADDVEEALIEEEKLICETQALLKKAIKQVELQIALNREVKEELEMDWSDKMEAKEYDSIAGHLTNHSTNKQFFAGAAHSETNSTPDSWKQAVEQLIARAEAERCASVKLHTVMVQLRNDAAAELRKQSDRVCTAFKKNIERLLAAKRELEEQLKKTVKEVTQQEENIDQIERAIRAKDDPIRVAQTRLHIRQFRPNLEACKDPANDSLIDELNLLGHSLDHLKEQLRLAHQRLKVLQDVQLNLEKEIQLKRETLHIEEKQCLAKRAVYPSAIELQGFR